MMWAIDERRTRRRRDRLSVLRADRTAGRRGPGTYVATDAEFTHNVTHSWNHGLGEIVTALLDAGMQLTGLVEHDSVPWEALPGQMEQGDLDEWQLADRPWRLAAYTLQAIKL